MRVAGIDPSLTGTGLAADGQSTTIGSKTPASSVAARAARIGRLSEAVSDWLSMASGDLVIIEAPSLGQRPQQGDHLRAGLWWDLALRFVFAGVLVLDVPPSTLKKFATGNGNANKADMRVAYLQRTGVDVRDDNQVDARWLREVGLHLIGDPSAIPLPKAQTDALASLRAQFATSG